MFIKSRRLNLLDVDSFWLVQLIMFIGIWFVCYYIDLKVTKSDPKFKVKSYISTLLKPELLVKN